MLFPTPGKLGADRTKKPKTGGRKKGVPNTNTTALKEMILAALDGAGGLEYLQRQADESPAAFMTLLGKVLPTTLTGDPEQPVKVEFSWRK